MTEPVQTDVGGLVTAREEVHDLDVDTTAILATNDGTTIPDSTAPERDNNWTISDVISRDYLVGKVEWSGDMEIGSYQRFSILDLLNAHGPFKEMARSFDYFKFDSMKIELRYNMPMTAQGLAKVYYQPPRLDLRYDNDDAYTEVTSRTIDGAMFSLCESVQPVVHVPWPLLVPFIILHTKTEVNTIGQDRKLWGDFIFMVFGQHRTPPGESSTITMQMYIRLENPSFSVPISPSNISLIYDVPFDPTPVPPDPIPDPTPSSSGVRVAQGAEKVVYTPSTSRFEAPDDTDPILGNGCIRFAREDVNTAECSTSVEFLKRQPGYLGTFNIKRTDAPDLPLWRCPVTPVAVENMTFDGCALVSYLSELWYGDMEYEFYISKSFLHTFTLKFVWQLSGSQPTLTQGSVSINESVTFTGSRAYKSIKVPWQQLDYYGRTRATAKNGRSAQGRINGFLHVILETPLMLPTTGATSIDISVWRRGGTDLKFFSPFCALDGFVTVAQGVGDQETVENVGITPPSTLGSALIGSDRPAPFIPFIDLKTYLCRMFKSRIQPSKEVKVNLEYWPEPIPASPFSMLFETSGYARGGCMPVALAKMFLYWIGGMHFTAFTDVDVPQYVIGGHQAARFQVNNDWYRTFERQNQYYEQGGINPYTSLPTNNYVVFQTPATCPRRAFYTIHAKPPQNAGDTASELWSEFSHYHYLHCPSYQRTDLSLPKWIEFRCNLSNDFEVGGYRGIHYNNVERCARVYAATQTTTTLPRYDPWPIPALNDLNLEDESFAHEDVDVQMYRLPRADMRSRMNRVHDTQLHEIQVIERVQRYSRVACSPTTLAFNLVGLALTSYNPLGEEGEGVNEEVDAVSENDADLLISVCESVSDERTFDSLKFWFKRLYRTHQDALNIAAILQQPEYENDNIAILSHIMNNQDWNRMRCFPWGFHLMDHPTANHPVMIIHPTKLLRDESLAGNLCHFQLVAVKYFRSPKWYEPFLMWTTNKDAPFTHSVLKPWRFDASPYLTVYRTHNWVPSHTTDISLPFYIIFNMQWDVEEMFNEVKFKYEFQSHVYREIKQDVDLTVATMAQGVRRPLVSFLFDQLPLFPDENEEPHGNLLQHNTTLSLCPLDRGSYHDLYYGFSMLEDLDFDAMVQVQMVFFDEMYESVQTTMDDVKHEVTATTSSVRALVDNLSRQSEATSRKVEEVLASSSDNLGTVRDLLVDVRDDISVTRDNLNRLFQNLDQQATRTSNNTNDLLESIIDGSFFSRIFPAETGPMYLNTFIDLLESLYVNTPGKWALFALKLSNVLGISASVLQKCVSLLEENAPRAESLTVNTNMSSVIPNILTMLSIGIGMKIMKASECSNERMKTTWEYFQWKCREISNVRQGVTASTSLFKDLREMLLNSLIDLGMLTQSPDHPTDAGFDELLRVVIDDLEWLKDPANSDDFHLVPDKIVHFEEIWARVNSLWKIWATRKCAPEQNAKFVSFYRNFERILDRVVDNSPSEIFRVDPFQIGIAGAPGVGKGGVMLSLARVIAHIQGWSDNKLLFCRTPGMKHFDGYGPHPIYVEDDKDQFDGSEEMLYDIMFKSNAEVTVPMARLEQKGAKFRSYLMLHTTNVKDPKATGAASTKAYKRRRDFLVNTTMQMVDGQRVYTFQELDPINIQNVGQPMSMAEFFCQCQNRFTRHMENQFRLMASLRVRPHRNFKFLPDCTPQLMRAIYEEVCPATVNTPIEELPGVVPTAWNDIIVQALVNRVETEPDVDYSTWNRSVPNPDIRVLHPNQEHFPGLSEKITVPALNQEELEYLSEHRQDLYSKWYDIGEQYLLASFTGDVAKRESLETQMETCVLTSRRAVEGKLTATQQAEKHLSWLRDHPESLPHMAVIRSFSLNGEELGPINPEIMLEMQKDLKRGVTNIEWKMSIDDNNRIQLMMEITSYIGDERHVTHCILKEENKFHARILAILLTRMKSTATDEREKAAIQLYLSNALVKVAATAEEDERIDYAAYQQALRNYRLLVEKRNRNPSDLSEEELDQAEELLKRHLFTQKYKWRHTGTSTWESPPHKDGPRYSHPVFCDADDWAAIFNETMAAISSMLNTGEFVFGYVIFGWWEPNLFGRQFTIPIPFVPFLAGATWTRWFISTFVPPDKQQATMRAALANIMVFRGLFDPFKVIHWMRWTWYNVPLLPGMMWSTVALYFVSSLWSTRFFQYGAASVLINPKYTSTVIHDFFVELYSQFAPMAGLRDNFTPEFVPPHDPFPTDAPSLLNRIWARVKNFFLNFRIVNYMFSDVPLTSKLWVICMDVIPVMLALVGTVWALKFFYNRIFGAAPVPLALPLSATAMKGISKQLTNERAGGWFGMKSPPKKDKEQPVAEAIQTHEHADVPQDGQPYYHVHLCINCSRPYGHTHARHTADVSALFPLLCPNCHKKEKNQAKADLMRGRPSEVSVLEDEIPDKIGFDEIIVEGGYALSKAAKTSRNVTLTVQKYGNDKASRATRTIRIRPQSTLSEDEIDLLIETIPDVAPGAVIKPESTKADEVYIPPGDKLDDKVAQSSGFDALCEKVVANSGIIRIANTISRVNYLGICDRIIAMPSHLFVGKISGKVLVSITRLGETFLCEIDIRKDILNLPNINHKDRVNTVRDTCFVLLRNQQVPVFKDLRNYLISASRPDGDSRPVPIRTAEGKPASLLYCHPDTGIPSRIAIPNLALKGSCLYMLHEKGEEYYYASGATWYYNVPTMSGMCGGALVSEHVGSNGGIIGLHVFGHLKVIAGGSDMLSKEMWDYALKDKPIVQSLPDIKDDLSEFGIELTYDVRHNIDIPSGTAYYPIGKINKPAHIPTKSDLVPSVLFDKVFKHETEFSVLDPNDPRNLTQKNPYVIAGQKFHTLPPFPKEIQEEVWKDTAREIVSCYNSANYQGPMRVLTVHEAINGVPGFIDPIQMNTSEGFPFTAIRPPGASSRAWLFEFTGEDEDGRKLYSPTPLLSKWINRIILAAKNDGVCVLNFFTDWLKDERRKLNKIEQGKTRMFSGHNIAWLIVLRMYFQCIDSFLYHHGRDIGFAPGMDTHGVDATLLINALLEHPHFSCMDVSAWDGAFQAYESTMCARVYIYLTNLLYTWPSESEKDAEIVVMETLVTNINGRFHVYLNIIYFSTSGMPSGSKFTTPWNTIGHRNRQKMCFLFIIRNLDLFVKSTNIDRATVSSWNLNTFRENTQIFTYGDDIVDSTSTMFFKYWNIQTRVKCLNRFGYKYTPADKNATFGTSLETPFEDVTFLKSNFVRDTRFPTKWHFAMDKITIQELTNWVRSGIDSTYALQSNIRDAQEMAYAHGEEYFDEFTSLVERAIVEHKVPIHLGTFESFDYRWKQSHGIADYVDFDTTA